MEDKKLESFDLYSNWCDTIPILDLQRWVDAQIKAGKNNILLNIEWGHYNDIDGLTLTAE